MVMPWISWRRAKDYHSFFRFLGDEKPLGSPFQINFPTQTLSGVSPFDPPPRNCYDSELTSRCTCIDCPDICPTLLPVAPPDAEPTCTVGSLTCLSFILTITYTLAVVGFLTGYAISALRRHRRERSYERVALSEEPSSPRNHTHGLVGVRSLSQHVDEDSVGAQSESPRLGRGASPLDPIETFQPRQYRLNNILRKGFYHLGFFAANHPWLTFLSHSWLLAYSTLVGRTSLLKQILSGYGRLPTLKVECKRSISTPILGRFIALNRYLLLRQREPQVVSPLWTQQSLSAREAQS